MRDPALAGQVRQIMADTFGIDESELPDCPSQANLGRWTSILHMVLLVALEEQFELTLSMDEMTSMTSMDHILDVLSAKLAVGLNA
jgi:acyl carrier protein